MRNVEGLSMKAFSIREKDFIMDITFPFAGTARVRARRDFDCFTDKESFAVVKRGETLELDVSKDSDTVSVSPVGDEGCSVMYDELRQTFAFLFQGEKIAESIEPIYNNKKGTFIDFNLKRNLHHFYGLGEKTGKLEKSGQDWVLSNKESYSYCEKSNAMYLSIPYFLVMTQTSNFGIFLDQAQHSFFDFGRDKKRNRFSFGSESHHEIDFYFFFGSTPAEIGGRYFRLTGNTYIPPRRALGHHQCRWSYKNEEEVRTVMANFRKHDVPADMLYFDIDYMDRFKMFSFDKAAFPNMTGLLSDIKEAGYHPVFIIDPGIKQEAGYHVYDEGVHNNHFVKDSHGLWQGTVWANGYTVFPDFFKESVREWWVKNHEEFFNRRIGHDVDLWNDMNEPAHCLEKSPEDVYFNYNGKWVAYREFHNAFALMEATATNAYAKKSGKRKFVLSRSGFAGIQRYAGVWTGDNYANYSHLRMTIAMVLNLSISGVPVMGCDGLGYAGLCTPGMAIRWSQAMVLFPIFRFHSAQMFPAKEPWSFGKVVLKQIRAVMKLRYSFIPHLYSLMLRAHFEGKTIIEPVFYNYPHDKKTYHLDNHYMVGKSILVAPVVQPLNPTKRLYLPEGEWIRLDDGKRYKGGSFRRIFVPFSRVPIFIKSGSIIFRQKPGCNNLPADKCLYVHLYPNPAVSIEEYFYDDDGTTFDSKLTRIKVSADSNNVVFTLIEKGDTHFDEIAVVVDGDEKARFAIATLTDGEKMIPIA
jgi:alpha-glucosidase